MNLLRGFEELRTGEHLCYIFGSKEEYWPTLAAYLQGGLKRHEKLLCVSTPDSFEECLRQLNAAGLDLQSHLDSGQADMVSAPELYLSKGVFDLEILVVRIEEASAQARAQGYRGLRLAAGAGWAADRLIHPLRLVETECRANEVCANCGCTVLCSYDRWTTSPGLLLRLLTAHPLAIVAGQIHANFLYVPGKAREWACAPEGVGAGEEAWRILLNASTDAAVLIDAQGTIHACNEAMSRRFSKPVSELIGVDIYSFFSPELARTRRLHAEGVFRSGKPAYFEDCREGVDFEHSTYPLFDTLGRVKMVASFGRDITDRKRSEEALRRTAEQFRAIADSAYDWEVWRDPEGKLRWTNTAGERITGYSDLEFASMPDFPLPLFHEEDREPMGTLLCTALAQRTSGRHIPVRIQRKDGVTRWVEISWQPVYDLHGTYLGIRTNARDISDQMPPEKPAEPALPPIPTDPEYS